MKTRAIHILAVAIGLMAALCTLPLLPAIWLWAVLNGEEL